MTVTCDRVGGPTATSTRSHGGLDIGLRIVTQLVEAHRGWVRPPAKGVDTK